MRQNGSIIEVVMTLLAGMLVFSLCERLTRTNWTVLNKGTYGPRLDMSGRNARFVACSESYSVAGSWVGKLPIQCRDREAERELASCAAVCGD